MSSSTINTTPFNAAVFMDQWKQDHYGQGKKLPDVFKTARTTLNKLDPETLSLVVAFSPERIEAMKKAPTATALNKEVQTLAKDALKMKANLETFGELPFNENKQYLNDLFLKKSKAVEEDLLKGFAELPFDQHQAFIEQQATERANQLAQEILAAFGELPFDQRGNLTEADAKECSQVAAAMFKIVANQLVPEAIKKGMETLSSKNAGSSKGTNPSDPSVNPNPPAPPAPPKPASSPRNENVKPRTFWDKIKSGFLAIFINPVKFVWIKFISLFKKHA